MNKNNKRLADLWTLISSLNCARYAIVELSQELDSDTKYRFKNLKNFIENFLRSAQTKMTTKQKENLSETNFESVGAMIETMTLLPHIPISKHEEFLVKVNKLVLEVIESDMDESEQEKESH